MAFPVLITNFKTYKSATGQKALELAKIHEKVAVESGVNIVIAVQNVDIRFISAHVSIPVLAQHFDPYPQGKNTGFTLAEALKEGGAAGSLLNHAEHKIDHHILNEAIVKARELGLFTVVCAVDSVEANEVAAFRPDCIAVEPPSLIGGDVSVSKAAPHIIKESIGAVPHMPILVGAGVKNAEDVRIALQLGASGVLLASGITTAKDPEAVLRDLVKGFNLSW